jgi:hypothetical protein
VRRKKWGTGGRSVRDRRVSASELQTTEGLGVSLGVEKKDRERAKFIVTKVEHLVLHLFDL